MIAVIDYDAGNLASVKQALLKIGEEVVVTRDPDILRSADRVILPGVGAFGDAMGKLIKYNLVDVIKEIAASGKPFMGICLGLQLMFESSEETPGVEGLGIIKGKICRIPDKEGLKIPHIGWNDITITPDTKLFKDIPNNSYVYFVHSYYLKAEEDVVAATTDYSTLIHAAVERGNVCATQFHPEKSGDVGLNILRNFAKM